MPSAKLSPHTDNLFLGKGALYFDRFDQYDVKTGELHLGNVTDFSISKGTTKKDHYTSMEGIRKKDKTITVEEKWTGKFTAEEYSRENVLLAIGGDLTAAYITQSAGSSSDNITAKRDRWIPLSYRSLSAVVVTHGAKTFVVNVDYKMDLTYGRIMPLYTGAMYEDEPINVAYSYASINQPVLNPSQNEVRGYVHFIPNNDRDNGPNYEVQVWSAVLVCNGDIGLISEDWGKLPFEIEIDEDDAGGTHKESNPYFRMIEPKASTIIS